MFLGKDPYFSSQSQKSSHNCPNIKIHWIWEPFDTLSRSAVPYFWEQQKNLMIVIQIDLERDTLIQPGLKSRLN